MIETYLDYNASSAVRAEAVAAMSRAVNSDVGNPSSIHRHGHRSKMHIESARESVARLLAARPDEIIFTSGGTEANNLAILGTARRFRGGHIIASAIEHSSVLEPLRHLEVEGFRITRILPDAEGTVSSEIILGEVRDDTVLVSLMHSSNEIGTVQPVAEMAARLRAKGILIHTDAVQSAGKVPIQPRDLGVDLLSVSAHKIGGPPGVGCLWAREGVSLVPLIRGGGQESNRRAGTEPVPLIAGFGAAAALASSELATEPVRIQALRDRLERELERRIPGLRFHGRFRARLPNTISVAVEGCAGEEMAMALDLEGIAVSTGSACAVGTVRPSHVLTAMGCPEAEARSTLRISLGHGTTEEHLERLLQVFPGIARRIRKPADFLPVLSAAPRGREA